MIIVDTHALIWFISDTGKLSPRAAAAIRSADQIAFSAISCWELAMLVRRRRISLDRDIASWWNTVLGLLQLRMLPITPDIGTAAAELSGVLRDPADCLIAATAIHHHSPLVTRDARIREAQIVETIW